MAEMKKNGSEDEFSVDEPDEEVGSDSDGSWNEDDDKVWAITIKSAILINPSFIKKMYEYLS